MKVLVADDHEMMRDALAGAVQLASPAAQVETAADFASAGQTPGPFALILCDLIMPGAAPLAGVIGLMAVHVGTPVLVVTGTEDDDLLLALIAAGVAGFLPKTSSSGVIEAAIRLVLAGGRYLPPRLAALTAAPAASSPPVPTLSTTLTPRQHEVLLAIAEGQSTKEIAAKLNIAPATVKAHTATLLSMLDAGNRIQAVKRARDLGFL
jgi:two-component system, NarL family, nitrate/nitrite response regulator NarL